MALAAFQTTVTDDAGNVLPGATIEVRAEAPGLPLVQMFSDRDGLVALGNPYVSVDGHVLLYVDGGAYRIKATSGLLIRELHNVAIGTAAENDIDDITALLSTVLVEDTTPQLGGPLDTNGHQVRWSKGADVASAAALVLGDDGNYFDITGTDAITSIATKGVGTVVKLRFDGSLTLTHDATDLVLPGAGDVTTAAGDEAEFVEYAAGGWRCTNYQVATIAPGLPITKMYESPPQVIVSGGPLTLAHGLGTSRLVVQVELECLTAEGGYSVGDRVVVGNAPTWSNVPNNAVVVVTDTQLKIRMGSYVSVFSIANFTTGALHYAVNANWQVRFRAFA